MGKKNFHSKKLIKKMLCVFRSEKYDRLMNVLKLIHL